MSSSTETSQTSTESRAETWEQAANALAAERERREIVEAERIAASGMQGFEQWTEYPITASEVLEEHREAERTRDAPRPLAEACGERITRGTALLADGDSDEEAAAVALALFEEMRDQITEDIQQRLGLCRFHRLSRYMAIEVAVVALRSLLARREAARQDRLDMNAAIREGISEATRKAAEALNEHATSRRIRFPDGEWTNSEPIDLGHAPEFDGLHLLAEAFDGSALRALLDPQPEPEPLLLISITWPGGLRSMTAPEGLFGLVVATTPPRHRPTGFIDWADGGPFEWVATVHAPLTVEQITEIGEAARAAAEEAREDRSAAALVIVETGLAVTVARTVGALEGARILDRLRAEA